MRATIIDENKKADWDRFVNASPHVISWHRYDWSEVLRKNYNSTFYPIAVYDGSKISGILPLYQVDTLRTGRTLISIPFVVAGGIVAEEQGVQQLLLNRAIALARETKSVEITLKQYRMKINGALRTDEGYYNRELTLSKDIDQVWNSMSETNRAKIQEAEKYNLVLDYPSQDVGSFYEVLFRNQHALGIPCVSREWVECLLATRMYHVALLKLKESVVAGTLVKKFKDTVSFPLTSLPDQDEKSMLLAYGLYWKLITGFAAEGIRIFHSGRIPKSDVAPRYRLGWGGEKHNYYYQYYGDWNRKAIASSDGSRKRKIFESVWKKIPAPMAKIMGPAIVGQFP